MSTDGAAPLSRTAGRSETASADAAVLPRRTSGAESTAAQRPSPSDGTGAPSSDAAPLKRSGDGAGSSSSTENLIEKAAENDRPVRPRGSSPDIDVPALVPELRAAVHDPPMSEPVARLAPIQYWTDDPVEHFQIRVTLRRQRADLRVAQRPTTFKAWELLKKMGTAVAEAAARGVGGGGRGRGPESPRSDHGDAGPDPEDERDEEKGEGEKRFRGEEYETITRTFEWQEKVLSAREILRYAHHKHKSTTPLEHEYEKDVKRLLSSWFPEEQSSEISSRRFCSERGGMQLATKVDDDGFVDPEDLRMPVTSQAGRPSEASSSSLNPLAWRVVHRPHDRRARLAHDQHYQSFRVVALVDLPDSPNEVKSYAKASEAGHERVLAEVRVYPSGTVDIRPAFSPQLGGPGGADEEEGWYWFKSPAGVLYGYRVENASGSHERREQDAREERIRRDLLARELDLQRNRVGLEFEAPPPPTHVRLNCFGELVEAYGFADRPNLYCEYELVLPAEWVWSPRDAARQMAACTQVADPVDADRPTEHYARGDPVWNWCFPLEFELLGTAGAVYSPTLLVLVCSVDFWERHRVEGYAFVPIPKEAGLHDLRLDMWRPEGSIRQQVQRYQVGGAPVLSDAKLTGLPEDFVGHFHSRYGFRTVPAGNVRVRLNIARTHDRSPEGMWQLSASNEDLLASSAAFGARRNSDPDKWRLALKSVMMRSRAKALGRSESGESGVATPGRGAAAAAAAPADADSEAKHKARARWGRARGKVQALVQQ